MPWEGDAMQLNTDCLEWPGRRMASGYGVFWTGSENALAHRVVWEQINGPIPEGMFVCHRCGDTGHVLILPTCSSALTRTTWPTWSPRGGMSAIATTSELIVQQVTSTRPATPT